MRLRISQGSSLVTNGATGRRETKGATDPTMESIDEAWQCTRRRRPISMAGEMVSWFPDPPRTGRRRLAIPLAATASFGFEPARSGPPTASTIRERAEQVGSSMATPCFVTDESETSEYSIGPPRPAVVVPPVYRFSRNLANHRNWSCFGQEDLRRQLISVDEAFDGVDEFQAAMAIDQTRRT